jgi:hypothetical protein
LVQKRDFDNDLEERLWDLKISGLQDRLWGFENTMALRIDCGDLKIQWPSG